MQEHFLLLLSSVLFLFHFCHWACVILMKMLASNYQCVPFKRQIKIILATGIKPLNLIVPPCPGICAQLSEKLLISQASLNFVLYERIVWEGHRRCFLYGKILHISLILKSVARSFSSNASFLVVLINICVDLGKDPSTRWVQKSSFPEVVGITLLSRPLACSVTCFR